MKKYLLDAAFLLFGTLLFGLGVRLFFLPHTIVPGGTTGLAIVAEALFGWRAGLVSAVINLPLLALAYVLGGGNGFFHALIGILTCSAFIDLPIPLPSVEIGATASAVIGGVLTGAGLAFALLRGFTSGGSDLAAHLIRLRYSRISLGRLVLLIDGGIILLAALVLRNPSGSFYSVLAALCFSLTLDLSLAMLHRLFSRVAVD